MSAGRGWALAPVVLLVLCVGGQAVLVAASRSQPGLAVTPHYYEEAQRWDERHAQEQRVADLGWRVDVDVLAGREVEVRLSDREGAPLRGATVEVQALHPARPDRPWQAQLVERAPGRYAAAASFDRAGAWELQVLVRRGAERTRRVFVRQVGGGEAQPLQAPPAAAAAATPAGSR